MPESVNSAEEDSIASQDLLVHARALVSELENGNTAAAEKILSELSRVHESLLFRKLGKLIRQLHDTLKNFHIEPRLFSLAQDGIPDAKERLHYIIDMTSDAANRTLSAIEHSLPLCDALHRQSHEINRNIESYRSNHINSAESKAMLNQITDFMTTCQGHTSDLRKQLSDAMLAQEFQDLSGQTIKRVILLIEEVEEKLVDIIKMSSPGSGDGYEKDIARKPASALEGPQLPSKKDNNAVSGQDEVDDLLSDLGF